MHIQGIGLKTERKIWQDGILTWDDFLNKKHSVFSIRRDAMICKEIERSRQSIDQIEFFAKRLPNSQQWRLFNEYRSKSIYLDIETALNEFDHNEITIIGIYDGHRVKSFINGINLDQFEIEIASYDLMVTFNGSGFDIPHIKKAFPGITLPPSHIDLMFLMKGLGYRGGLKKIEKLFDLKRSPEIDGLNGYDAIKLWQAYLSGYEPALNRLLDYNAADIVNLQPLMEFAFLSMKEKTLESGFSV
jgi:uncharacterized protein YprB with RNaseH-like and TPR domain